MKFTIMDAVQKLPIGIQDFEKLRKQGYLYVDKTSEETLNSVDASSTNPIPVIYQSGYLTIKDFDPEFQMYTLGFPNKEVEEGFTRFLTGWNGRRGIGADRRQALHFAF